MSVSPPSGPSVPSAVTVEAEVLPRFDEILTADALDLVAELTQRFGSRRTRSAGTRSRASAALAEDWPQSFTAYAYDRYLIEGP